MTKKWAITLRRTEISEHVLDLVVEAPTLEAALTAAPKVTVDDLDWELYDFHWANEPLVVDKHGEAGLNAAPDFVADAEGNLTEGTTPKMPPSRPTGAASSGMTTERHPKPSQPFAG